MPNVNAEFQIFFGRCKRTYILSFDFKSFNKINAYAAVTKKTLPFEKRLKYFTEVDARFLKLYANSNEINCIRWLCIYFIKLCISIEKLRA